MITEQQQQGWDKSGLKEACQRALKLGRTHQETDIQLFLDMLLEIERLESIVKGQETDRSERREPYSDECRAAIDDLEQRFESEEVELCSIEHAQQREDYGADQMRSLCVEKVKSRADEWQARAANSMEHERIRYSAKAQAARTLAAELESLTLQEQKS